MSDFNSTYDTVLNCEYPHSMLFSNTTPTITLEIKFKINDNDNGYIHVKSGIAYRKYMEGKYIEPVYDGGTVPIGYRFNSDDTIEIVRNLNIYEINGTEFYDDINDIKIKQIVVTSDILDDELIEKYTSACYLQDVSPLGVGYCYDEYSDTTRRAIYITENSINVDGTYVINKNYCWLDFLTSNYYDVSYMAGHSGYFKSDGDYYTGAFPKCYKDYDLNIIIPDGTKKIPDYFMYGLPIKSLQLPESLEYIGERAFAGSPCGYYLSNDIADNVHYTKTARNECTELHIPENVKHIGDGAFAFWYKLRKIIIDCDVFWDDDNTKYYNLGNLIFYAGKSNEHNHCFNRDGYRITDDSLIVSDYIDTYNEHTIINTYRDVTSYILDYQLHVVKTEVVCKNENIYNYMFSKDNRIISNKDYMYIVNGDFLYSHALKDKGNIEIIIDDNCKKYLSVSELKDTDYNKLVINIDGKYYAVDR